MLEDNFKYEFMRNNLIQEKDIFQKKITGVWSISDLKLIFQSDLSMDQSLITEWNNSFNRTKVWLENNHPEYFV